MCDHIKWQTSLMKQFQSAWDSSTLSLAQFEIPGDF